jgi:hypothetical protein
MPGSSTNCGRRAQRSEHTHSRRIRHVAHGDELALMFLEEDVDALLALAGKRPGGVVRFLTGRLYAAEQEEKWRAVRMLGVLARQPGLITTGRLRDFLQRLLWALNDESGAVPFGVPEAIGEILAVRPEHRPSILPVLCGMLTEEETFQTGPVERGIYWALGRIGPDALDYCPGLLAAVSTAAQSHPDAETRATAAAALARLDPRVTGRSGSRSGP